MAAVFILALTDLFFFWNRLTVIYYCVESANLRVFYVHDTTSEREHIIKI